MTDEPVVYFERIEIGTSAKMVAIDAGTGIEVTVIGPSHTSQTDLQKLALAKLRARMAREQT